MQIPIEWGRNYLMANLDPVQEVEQSRCSSLNRPADHTPDPLPFLADNIPQPARIVVRDKENPAANAAGLSYFPDGTGRKLNLLCGASCLKSKLCG